MSIDEKVPIIAAAMDLYIRDGDTWLRELILLAVFGDDE